MGKITMHQSAHNTPQPGLLRKKFGGLQNNPAPKPEILLSVVIVSWNTRDLLEQCLLSLDREVRSRYHPTQYEIFVIDNCSTDGTGAMIEKKYPWVNLIINQANLGFAQANNVGILRSKGQFILLLNPDTELLASSIENLIAYLNDHPNVGLAGPKLLNPDRSLQESCYPTPTLFREFWRLLHMDRIYPLGIYAMERWSSEEPRSVEVLKGACILARREALVDVGVLDESFFMYTEEVDWCYRMRKAGWEIHWVPAAQVLHYGGQSTRQVAEAMFLHLYKSKIHFFRKHYGKHGVIAYKSILFATAAIRVLGWSWLQLVGRHDQYKQNISNYLNLIRSLPAL